MIEKLVRKLNQFYHFAFILIMVGILSTIFYFWKSGFIDGSRNKELHKANFILESITTEKPLKEVRMSVYNENPRQAIEKLTELEKKMERLNSLADDDKYPQIKKQFGEVKTAVASLISYSKTSKILSVFNSKLEKYNDYVKDKEWRTLTRTSSRVLGLTQGHINKKKLGTLVNTIDKDFAYMLKVTENSVLADKEKAEINSRISNLQIETSMLTKYVNERNDFYAKINSFNKDVAKWIERVSPELSYQRLQVEQMGRYYMMGLFGILILVSGLFFSSFIFQKWHRRNASGELESFLENFVSNRIVANSKDDYGDFSNQFKNFTDDISDYVEKRMSYGSIFQKALPLSSIMLDKNLKVAWANKQFCEDWSLSEDEIKKDYLSWDYLSKLTNLGDNDPVLEALKNKVAGIYQVQIRVSEDAEVSPFEMFVNPVEYKNETRVMLFFYPLYHLQETIKEQAKTINNPIEKTLRLIASNEFKTHPKDELQNEYNIAGISPLLEKFENIVSIFDSEQSRLFDQIEMLYHKIEVLENKTNVIEFENEKLSVNNKGQIHDLKAFKESIIQASTTGKMSEDLAKAELESIEKMLSSFESNYSKAKTLKEMISSLSSAMPKFASIKDEVKAHKNLLSDTKMRLSHSLSQMVHLKKKITDAEVLERFNNSYDRVGIEFKNLDTTSIELDKKISSLEVMLSKGQMVLNDVHSKLQHFDLITEGHALVNGKDELEKFKRDFRQVEGVIEGVEGPLIENLKSMYHHTKANLLANRNIAEQLLEEQSEIGVDESYSDHISTNDDQSFTHEPQSSL